MSELDYRQVLDALADAVVAADGTGPDYKFGWGLMDTRKAAELIRNDATNGWKSFIKEVFLNDGGTIEGRDEYEQAKVIFGKIRSLVEAAGGAMADVVKMTIYVVNIKNNTAVWRARQSSLAGISHARR